MTGILVVAFAAVSILFSVATSLFVLFAADSIIRGHDIPTSRQAAKQIFEIIRRHAPGEKNFYDLGCARGWLAVAVKKQFPQCTVYGIDQSRLRLFFARLRAFVAREAVTFKQGDVLKTDLRNADVVYAYLWYDLLPPLEEKLQRELKPGTVIITNTSHFARANPDYTYVVHPKTPDFEKLFVSVKR